MSNTKPTSLQKYKVIAVIHDYFSLRTTRRVYQILYSERPNNSHYSLREQIGKLNDTDGMDVEILYSELLNDDTP